MEPKRFVPKPFRVLVRGGVAPVALQPGEEVVLSDPATMLALKARGVLTLTNHRLVFHPEGFGGRREQREAVNLPLGEITVLKLVKPLLGGAPLLRVGTKWHEPEYELPNALEWLEAIQQLQAGGGVPPPAAPEAVGPPEAPEPVASVPAPAESPELGPPCPICGTATVRQADGSLRCVQCQPP